MADQISICNLALSWLGGNQITSLSDDSTEAKLCSANYDPAKNAVLEDRDWTFATARAIPNRLATPPLFGFASAFQLPTKPRCLRIIDVARDVSFMSKLDIWVREGDQILSNEEIIYIRYIYELVDPNKFSPGFVQSLAARLAADICIPLTHDKELYQTYWALYTSKLEQAGSMDGLQSISEKLGLGMLNLVR